MAVSFIMLRRPTQHNSALNSNNMSVLDKSNDPMNDSASLLSWHKQFERFKFIADVNIVGVWLPFVA